MKKYLPAILLIIIGISMRLVPHPANFAPIGAIAIFGGLYLPKKWSLLIPLLAMFASDIIIGFYSTPIMFSVYIGFALMGLIGLYARKRKNTGTILGGTIIGSTIFYLVTNAAVWFFGTLYSHDLSGLLQSYVMAIPFFRNSLLGDLFYTGILVGAYEIAAYYLELKKTSSKQKLAEG